MGIIDLIFPKICVGCSRQGEYICCDCQKELRKPEEICPECGKPSLDGRVHARCRTRQGMDGLVAGLSYHGMVQQCLKKVKYKSAFDIIQFLYRIAKLAKLEGSMVTCVPMWRGKERKRGFNQAKVLAEIVAKEFGLKEVDLLSRIRPTSPMFGLKKSERRENVRGAFKLLDPANKLVNQNIILVDDVWTTGATMRECARVLRRSGAETVWGLTLAR